MINDSFA